MLTLTDSIEVRTTPERLFDWFMNLDLNYKQWHADHVEFIFKAGSRGLSEGSIICFKEFIHGKLHKLSGKITKIEKNKKIEYKFFFPLSVICTGGSFLIQSKEKSCIFTSTLSFRAGALLSAIAKNRVLALKKHVSEEGENLKSLMENAGH